MKIIKLKYRAFTLVELLAVIGLIAILSMVVTTSAQRITKEVRLSTALNQVMSAVSEARSIAIRDRAEVLVAFTVYRKTVRVFPDTLSKSIGPVLNRPKSFLQRELVDLAGQQFNLEWVPMCLNQTIPQPVLLILRRCAKNLYQ